jgi:ubiquinone/menaquinone biosynthesis C-methylase UbiE
MPSRYWEFQNPQQMFELIGAETFGDDHRTIESKLRQYKVEQARAISVLLALKPEHHVLEIGVGPGLLALEIAPNVSRFYGSDISESFVKHALDQCQALNNVQLHVAEIGSLAFLPVRSVHRIYSIEVMIFCNIFEIYLYFKEMRRVLKPQGIVCLEFVYSENLRQGLKPLFNVNCERFEKYKGNGSFIQWNSEHAIGAIAKHFKFTFMGRHERYVLFKKG